ncbi:MAG: lipopolysaccharide heptosyltransferase family protein [Rhodospirillales bacterium]|nr:lipopolysaccharide heptosyltransferase family protein [Rhodospirillales bacterium]
MIVRAPFERILVIKLGALGDFVQAMAPAAAIRAHHPDAEIVLLTGAAFADLARRAPYFDEVWIDERPRLVAPAQLLALRHRLRTAAFTRVYDLQTSDRSSFYFRLMGPGRRPEWSGIARGASHPHDNPRRDLMHTIERQAEQLARAGIAATGLPSVAWAAADVARFALPEPFVILVPGGAAHRPEKRWPVALYAALARRIAAQGAMPVVVGGADEMTLGAAIAADCATACDLTGDTSLGEIVGLARRARRAIGNDTGPMHLLVAAGCPATVLYSAASDPALTAPRGAVVTILQRDDLAALSVEEVAATLAMD